MKKWQKLAVCGAIAAVVAGSGAAVAAGGVIRPANARPAAVRPVVAPTHESGYTPITPCRIVDTRSAGGPIGSGGTRSFYAAGIVGIALQGGKSGGCGVPPAASAVQVTITAVGASGNGYLKAYPYGSPTPNATFLNFTHAFNVSGAGSVKLCAAACARHLNVSVAGHLTNVVVDVQGYYLPPMWAFVSDRGGLQASSRAVTATRTGTGQYTVDFDRDVTNCEISTSVYYPVLRILQAVASGDGMIVAAFDTAGNLADTWFHVLVTC